MDQGRVQEGRAAAVVAVGGGGGARQCCAHVAGGTGGGKFGRVGGLEESNWNPAAGFKSGRWNSAVGIRRLESGRVDGLAASAPAPGLDRSGNGDYKLDQRYATPVAAHV